ncbi:MAG: hypothetical protein HY909_29975 [Deltaproteobacteria bacterium]|nr:hypothetical protein [Deltaproteobacteria bacterium]
MERQAPEHSNCPAVHTGVHTPATQDWPEGHVLPHPPQCAALVRVSASQPLPGFPSQFPKFVAQVKPQAPPAQVAEAFEGTGHAFPQPPQCAAVVRVSVSQPLPRSESQSPKLVLQVMAQATRAQPGVALARAGHTLPQAPQFDTSVRSASQPLVATPSQSPRPVAQVVPQRRSAQ